MDLTAAVDVIRAPLGEILPRLSDALSEAIAHRALAELSGNCPHSPFKTHGHPPGDPGSAITTVEMAALAPSARAEGSRQGRARMAGAEVPVLALYSDATAPGALLVLVLTEETPVPVGSVAAARILWDLVTAHRDRMAAEAVPGTLAQSRAAAAARATAIAELVDAHGAALSALLGVLRRRELEVLEELARGRRNRQIAQELRISESTVKFHVANILEKLGVTSRGEAAALAHTWGATGS